ncbi:LLM class flavin-dependent oxidoreductase [Nitrospirillum sp. BR 11752]|uniref:LLM class flavin-dependent oxidoreductase n=1 Tax=Nitrospirillum sp. BR 11752 TaxID=3104293 RepID=UPI002EB6207F|nr:LLM class flavin-dependent oxidoreductase [Nitrospirillum sp. BR 11752]
MKQIRLNAFDMNCVGHIHQGLWRHPRDRSTQYTDLAHWVDLARTLERGLFDGLFLADVLGVYDVYQGGPDAAVRAAVQVPVGDPLLLVPAMAAATTHLCFGVTANLSYEPPYTFARRMSTLDHLTGGRVGWNIVTGYLDSAARALGLDGQAAHDDRYAVAEEYMDVVYRLWEGSWADDAVRRDRAAGIYADPARVRAVRHHGPHFRMEGAHLCEPSPQRTPVLYQAGSSDRGRRFAAAHAECVFVNGGPKPHVARLVADLRGLARSLGRDPADLKVFVGATVVVAETDTLAQAKRADYERYASVEGALAHASASLGIDFAAQDWDDPIHAGQSQAVTSNIENQAARRPGKVLTRRGLVEGLSLGGRQVPIVGGPATVADELMAWVEEADVDGFILARTVTPECFTDFIDLVVPELQRRGAYKTAYAPGTLREKLSTPADQSRASPRGPRLPDTHPGASRRWPA